MSKTGQITFTRLSQLSSTVRETFFLFRKTVNPRQREVLSMKQTGICLFRDAVADQSPVNLR